MNSISILTAIDLAAQVAFGVILFVAVVRNHRAIKVHDSRVNEIENRIDKALETIGRAFKEPGEKKPDE